MLPARIRRDLRRGRSAAGRRLRLRGHPQKDQAADEAGHHPALQGLRHPPDALRRADRRADRVHQVHPQRHHLHGGQLLRRVRGAHRAQRCRRGHDRRLADQESRRRPRPHWRLHLRHRGVRGALRVPSLRAGPRTGGRRESRPDDLAVPGLLPRPDGHGRCAQGRDLRRQHLRAPRLPVRAQRHRVPARHHPGRRAGQRGGHARLLPRYPGRSAGGQLCDPPALGHARL